MSHYPVFILKVRLAMQDPDMPSPRYHTSIFVETGAQGQGSGIKHHVTGDIVQGMVYEAQPCHDDPTASEDVHSKVLIGRVDASSYPEAVNALLHTLPPPPKQKAFNIKTMKTEPVKLWMPLTFYDSGEAHAPLKKCTEWVEQDAIPALLEHSILEQRL